MGDYDPEEGIRYVNEILAEDDAGDPLLERYQHYGKSSGKRGIAIY